MVIPHNKPTLGQAEIAASSRVIESGWVAQGPEVEKFENTLSSYHGLPQGHSVALSSGTSSIYMALHALSAKGKKVAIPAYSCSSLRHAVSMIGATEILIDTFPNSPNIDIGILNKSSADIVIVPHMYGIPANIEKINKNIKVIEDCAQSLGARFIENPVGTMGDISIFSFYATKMITTGGQGGAVLSKNKNYIETIKDYRNFDYRNDNKSRFNFQMTDLQASIGIEQLNKLDYFLKKRNDIFSIYKSFELPMLQAPPWLRHVKYRAILKTSQQDKIIQHLKKNNIHSIIPIEGWEILGDEKEYVNSHNFSKVTISIPIYPSLTEEEAKLIAKKVKEVI